MTIESGTFVSDFVASNPGSSDLRSQGDDHLRLIKLFLQNTFPTASKAWYNPTSAAKSADFSVVATDMNKTFLVDTTAGIVNMTLPTLVAGDAGWECFLVKTNSGTSPVLVKPPSGTLSSGAINTLAAARRCIPNARIRCFWTGATFIVSRAEGVGGPIGSAIDLHVATLPVGYEWPTGQTLASASANYPEFNAVNGSGVTLDVRGRNGIPLDNLGGSAAGRLGGGIITGTAIGNIGGSDVIGLSAAQIPAISSVGTNSVSVVSNEALDKGGAVAGALNGTGLPYNTISGPTSVGQAVSVGSNTTAVNSNNTGGQSHSNLPPSIMIAKVLVVE